LEVGEKAGKDLVELVQEVDDHRDVEGYVIARLGGTDGLHALPEGGVGQLSVEFGVTEFALQPCAPCSSPFDETPVLSAEALSEPILQTGLMDKLDGALAVAGGNQVAGHVGSQAKSALGHFGFI